MKNKKTIMLIIVMLVMIHPINGFLFSDLRNLSLTWLFITGLTLTIYASNYVIKPISYTITQKNPGNIFYILSIVRFAFLLFLGALTFSSTLAIIVDFLIMIAIEKLFLPIWVSMVKANNPDFDLEIAMTPLKEPESTPNVLSLTKDSTVVAPTPPNTYVPSEENAYSIAKIKCFNCNQENAEDNKFCVFCGTPIEKNENTVVKYQNKKNIVRSYQFDDIYNKPNDVMLEEIIKREMLKIGLDEKSELIPSEILKKERTLNIIFAILVFVYISLIFFHFPMITYIIGLIILIVFNHFKSKYNFIKFLVKEIKSRPQEKISNIIMNVKNTLVPRDTKKLAIVSLIIAIILPLTIFINPKIIYEKTDGGYAVRFYTFGLTNFKTATIPEKHKSKDVVTLRGNTFSNMPFLEKVTLPDTITEIRGQAFKNCTKLKEVNIPKNLVYLGGGAFYNVQSITKIELPDTLEYLGGESFYKAISLKSVKLSENLTEIKGNTFENCESLKSITIPDKVTRIGGHAFYGNAWLSEVTISENSQLVEIGSSAFRQCPNLRKIKIPQNTVVNERAFKESPTKVIKYGEVDFDEIIDKNEYTYDAFIYLNGIGATSLVNEYTIKAKIYKASITLVDVELIQGSYQYKLKYVYEDGEKTFVLNKTTLSYQINSNIEVSLSNESVLTRYYNGLGLNVYYN